jgi:DNA-binding winged helix-turn-helix (wHTH) protein
MNSYLLNRNCVFNEDNLELRNKDNARAIKMTPMRARCLSLMIEKHDEKIIDKGVITTALWGERGQFVSDANLTQLLYLLRKDLREVGIHDFIITVPRIGIRVNHGIEIASVPAAQESARKERRITPALVVFSSLLCLLSLLATLGLFQAIAVS